MRVKDIVLTLGLVYCCGCSKGAVPEKPAVVAVETQGRRIDVTASFDGYHPKTIPVKAGEQVTLVFTRTEPVECLEEVTIPSQSIKRQLPVKQPVAIPFKADKPGAVDVVCGMNMVHATIQVE